MLPVATADTFVGAPGTVILPLGVMGLDSALGALVPTELLATTVNVYVVPEDNPDTDIVPLLDPDKIPCIPPGLEVAV